MLALAFLSPLLEVCHLARCHTVIQGTPLNPSSRLLTIRRTVGLPSSIPPLEISPPVCGSSFACSGIILSPFEGVRKFRPTCLLPSPPQKSPKSGRPAGRPQPPARGRSP